MDWKTGKAEWVEIDEEKIVKERCAFLDLSKNGVEELRWGEETMFINASIMDEHYQPENAPWVVNLELPKRQEDA